MQKDYLNKVHRWGILWDAGALLAMLAIPVAISVGLGVWPEAKILARVLSRLMLLYWTTAVIEVVTYVPMLGAGGTYLSFVTGNIANLKLPCGLAAMENAGVRANTEEGEVVSTIAVGVSAIVTTVIIAAGVLLFAPVLPKIAAEGSAFRPALEQTLPALFGALGASYFAKRPKLVLAPVVVEVAILVFAPQTGVGTLMFPTIIASCLTVLLLHKKNRL